MLLGECLEKATAYSTTMRSGKGNARGSVTFSRTGILKDADTLSLPKIPHSRIRVVTENQRIIALDARDPPFACSVYRQPVQVAASA
jgi:hypothetical protein